MTTTWFQEWPCVCNRGELTPHRHYPDGRHSCARGCGCKEYRADIPEAVAIRILLGPVMSDTEAADILLGRQGTAAESADYRQGYLNGSGEAFDAVNARDADGRQGTAEELLTAPCPECGAQPFPEKRHYPDCPILKRRQGTAAAQSGDTDICEKCQMRLPVRLLSFSIGVRGGTAAWCAACSPHSGPDAEAKRQEVVALRKAKLSKPLPPASASKAETL